MHPILTYIMLGWFWSVLQYKEAFRARAALTWGRSSCWTDLMTRQTRQGGGHSIWRGKERHDGLVATRGHCVPLSCVCVCVMPMHRDDMNECAERYGECRLLKTAISTSCLACAFQVSHTRLFDRRVWSVSWLYRGSSYFNFLTTSDFPLPCTHYEVIEGMWSYNSTHS